MLKETELFSRTEEGRKEGRRGEGRKEGEREGGRKEKKGRKEVGREGRRYSVSQLGMAAHIHN